MKVTVSKASEITSNNNVILTLVGQGQPVKTPFGIKTPKYTYLMAVEAGSELELGEEADLDLNMFDIRESSNVVEGKTLTSKWLSLKGE